MAKSIGTLTVTLKIKARISLWSAIKLRIAGKRYWEAIEVVANKAMKDTSVDE